MGKLCALLASLVLAGVCNQAFALDAQDCESQASRMKSAARNAFLTSCLARLASPENVRQAVLRKKRAVCERNAKNLSLHDDLKVMYIGSCIERNEAAQAYAHAGTSTYILRISLEQRALPEMRKPAPVVTIAQKVTNGRKDRQRSRQFSTCKNG